MRRWTIRVYLLLLWCMRVWRGVCAQLGQYEIASDCLRMYYNQHPAKDQFQCRALFCRALIESERATGLKGAVCGDSKLRRDTPALFCSDLYSL